MNHPSEQTIKTCFRCGEAKPLVEFYAHPCMRDGTLGKCKTCAKTDVTANRKARLEYYHEYDRRRHQEPERRADKQAAMRRSRALNPEKAAARQAVSNAKRAGRLRVQPCEVCGTTERVEAHHEDYSKPLDVRWLCFFHHREVGHGQTPTPTQQEAAA